MNAYVLIMVMSLYGDSVTTLEVPFDTEKACLAAMEKIAQDLDKRSAHSNNIVWVRSANCFKKSVEKE